MALVVFTRFDVKVVARAGGELAFCGGGAGAYAEVVARHEGEVAAAADGVAHFTAVCPFYVAACAATRLGGAGELEVVACPEGSRADGIPLAADASETGKHGLGC